MSMRDVTSMVTSRILGGRGVGKEQRISKNSRI